MFKFAVVSCPSVISLDGFLGFLMHSFSTSGDTCGDYITLGKPVGDWLRFWAGMKSSSSGMVLCKVFA